jgi:hypothetical protein
MSRRRVKRFRDTIRRLVGGCVPRSLALAAFASLALAGVAGAASWSPPVTVGDTHALVFNPTLSFSGHGSALLGAQFVDDPGPSGHEELRLFGARHSTTYGGIGTFGVQYRAVRAYGARRAILVLGDVLSRNRFGIPTVRISYRIGTASGHFGQSHTLWTGRLLQAPVVAAANDGDIAIAWTEVRGRFSEEGRLWLARRSRNAPFHRPSVLAGSRNPRSASVAWDSQGNLLVAYARLFRSHGRTVRDVAVRVRRAAHPFGPARPIGPSQGVSDVVAGFAPGGRMYVAWGTQDGGEEANQPRRVYAASAISPSHRFAETQVLDPGGAIDRPAGRVVLAIGNDGSATVGWSAVLRTGAGAFAYPALVASADPAGHFAAAQQLAPSAAMEDLAFGPDAQMLAVFSTLPHGNYQQGEQVLAALRPRGAAQFDAPEVVSPVERALEARGAFDATTGRPTVVWTGQPDAGPYGPPYGPHPQALRASTR